MPGIFSKIPVSSMRSVLSVDLRSLALFRISLAVLLLANLALRSTELFDFYSEDGVLTRSQSISHAHVLRFSLYWIHSSEWFAAALMLISALAAGLLLIGYRSRWMAFISWILLLSLLNRNQFVHQAGDHLLALCVFWSLLLPIGARFSVDNALDRRYRNNLNPGPDNPHPDDPKDHQYFSIATVGVILQVTFVYLFTAFQKTGAPWRETMDAAYLAVQLDHIATPLGYFMRDYPALLTIGTWFVLYVEYAVIFLVLSPVFNVHLRFLTLVLLIFMHGVFLVSLHIGLFPLIDYVSLTVLVPAALWVWLSRRATAGTQQAHGSVDNTSVTDPKVDHRESIKIFYDGDCGFCRKTCLVLREFLLPSSVPILKAQSDPYVHKIMQDNDSWVVMDHQSRPLIHWHAMVYLFKQRMLLRPLAWIMNLPGFIHLGNLVYRFVARNRFSFSRFTERFVPDTNIIRRPGWINQLLAAGAIYIMVSSNLSSIDVDPHGLWYYYNQPGIATALEDIETTFTKVFRLEQNWNMFSPKPPTLSFMPVITGTLVNKSTVDVYNGTMSPPTWEVPGRMVNAYKSYRWRKYFENVRNHDSSIVRRGYGGHLCRTWNTDTREPQEKLGILEIWFLNHRTQPDNGTKPETRTKKWIHWCLPEFALDKDEKKS